MLARYRNSDGASRMRLKSRWGWGRVGITFREESPKARRSIKRSTSGLQGIQVSYDCGDIYRGKVLLSHARS